ncbi:hypothetical protein TrLO_g7395 [Triparma laevis f. longispina]|uniref:Sulfotransferase family protein n=1 Tax=Triparma laevis f. longispina TaxID=1714387 RepID=A0A9W7C4X1_9STRA|nr:hypothetical protein TrLO_g7395 [Triparma laevis f. longispina]
MTTLGTLPIILWAPPRSCSTAFERAIAENEKTKSTIFHEHFADPFYFGQDRFDKTTQATMDAVEKSLLVRDSTYDQQANQMLDANANGNVSFTKELSIYYQQSKLTPEILSKFRHTFLIRSPTKVMKSFWRAAQENADDGSSTYFDANEAGFKEIEMIMKAVESLDNQNIVIIDADDLMANPSGVLGKYCEEVGLVFNKNMLEWKAVMPESWEKWPGWHNDAAKSTGFVRRSGGAGGKQKDDEIDSEAVLQAIAETQPIYDRMYLRRIIV